MVQLALDYLQYFIIHFDRDRASLEDAYADNAILSCSVVRDKTLIVSEARAFSGCSSDSLLAIGPQEISQALVSFGDHRFFPYNTESSHIDYDIICLGNEQVLLIVHTKVVNDTGKRVAVDQTFILSSHTDDACRWPLLALSHQMVLRDSNWLPARLVTIPWTT
ncbi:hypothetical protein BDZ89DRAFT_295826 [Hymenopellis radicata]|nr:hypothetical protein BDZ89DRAFT_295826 [Hymenopellis radicata]